MFASAHLANQWTKVFRENDKEVPQPPKKLKPEKNSPKFIHTTDIVDPPSLNNEIQSHPSPE